MPEDKPTLAELALRVAKLEWWREATDKRLDLSEKRDDESADRFNRVLIGVAIFAISVAITATIALAKIPH